MICALATSACVTSVEPRKPAAETVLTVTKIQQSATLQWESDERAVYTVLYAPGRSAKVRWTPLPGYIRIQGTGQTIRIEDEIPAGQDRYYRLHTEPLVKRR